MSRRDFGKTVAASATLPAASGRSVGPGAARPNLLLICADQFSGRTLGCMGHPQVRTPHLDRIASQGVLFRNAYCSSPVCVPGRAALMTGAYPSDVDSYCNSTVFDGRIPGWGNHLKGAGYQGWATGKLDLKSGVDYGFQEVETTHQHDPNPDITSLFRRPLCYRVDERHLVSGSFQDRVYVDDERIGRLLEFVSRNRGQGPWFAYAGLELPHHPFIAHTRFQALYPPDQILLPNLPEGYLERQHLVLQAQRNFKLLNSPVPEQRIRLARAAHYAMITELDEYVGSVVERLTSSGQLENTVLIVTADHGEMLGEHGLWLKNNLLEDSARVPFLMMGGGLPQGRTIDTPVSHVDLAATLLDLGGVSKPPEVRGRSLLPLIRGDNTSGPDFVYGESHAEGMCTGSFMIRRGDWKLIHFSWYENLLFNLKDDPGELTNLYKHPEQRGVVQELEGLLRSQVDPEAVSERAFQTQERFLAGLVRQNTAQQFFGRLRGRLGPGQAGVYTSRFYPGFRSDSA